MEGLNLFVGIDVTVLIRVLLLCVGSVELVKTLARKDYVKATTIMISAIVGLLAGTMLEGIDPVSGLLIGLTASGTITALQNVGQK